MDEPGGYYAKQNQSDKDKYCMVSLTCGIFKKNADFIETEDRKVDARGWGDKEMRLI